MSKIWIIARHEFVTTVKRLGFVLVTFGLPLLMGGLMLGATLLSQRTMEAEIAKPAEATLYFVDLTGLFEGDFPLPHRNKWFRAASRAEAVERVERTKDATAVIIPEKYLETGAVEVVTSVPASIFMQGQALVPGALRNWMSRRLAGVPDERRMERILRPVESESTRYIVRTEAGILEESANERVSRFASGIAFFFILFLAIATTGGYLIQGLADEKENRVLEMVISSVTPTELMFGKLFGLGAAGLLQVAIWSSMGIITALTVWTAFLLNPVAFVFCGIFFLLGYFLYGSLMLGLGSLGANMRESTQYSAIVTMLAVSPMFFWMIVATAPQSTIARVLSYIPFTAPVTMMLRFTIDPAGTPWWEVLLVIAILAVSTWLAVKLAARLYRMGLLLYGKRPTPREIWRWLRAPEEPRIRN